MTPLIRDVTATELDLSLPQSSMLNDNDELYSTKSIDLSAGVTPTPADASLSLQFEIVDGGTGTGTITDAGVLTGGDPGTVNVKVTDRNSGLSNELTVTVCDYTAATAITATVPETGSTLNPDGELYNTKSVQLNIAKTPSGADAKYTFETQTGTTASVTISSDGTVTASDYGIAIIKVTDVLSGEESTVELNVCEYTAPEEFRLRDSDTLVTAANCGVPVVRIELYEWTPERMHDIVNVKPKITVTGTGSEDVETEVTHPGGVADDQFYSYIGINALSAAEGTFTIKVEDEITGMFVERTVVFSEIFARSIVSFNVKVDKEKGGVPVGESAPVDVITSPEYCETELSFTVSDSLGTVEKHNNGLMTYYEFVAGNTTGSGTITVSDQLSGQTATCSVTVVSN